MNAGPARPVPEHRAPEMNGMNDLGELRSTTDGAKRRRGGRSKSMHEGVAVWCDCCSCQAEPYWVEAGERLGIDLGSDYEPVAIPEADEN